MLSTKGILSIRNLSFTQPAYKKKAKIEFGLDKIERRHLKRRLLQAKSTIIEKHIFKTLYNIKDKFELFEIMKSKELYNEGGLIALCKPFGVPRKKQDHSERKRVVETLNASGNVSNSSIEEVLPLLKKHYEASNLEVAFYPERYTSGIILLSKNEKVTSRVKKCFRRSLASVKPYQTYWTVVMGKPVEDALQKRISSTLHYNPTIGNIPVLKDTVSKADIKKGKAKPNIVEQLVLAYNKELDVSLVQCTVMNIAHHFIRLWMAHCYTPVLGDLLCGGRVKTVMGQKVLVSPDNLAGYHPPDVPNHLLTKLYLSKAQVELIPTHIHQTNLRLEKYLSKNDLVINAPPPDHFAWTCMQLSLAEEGEEEEEDEDAALLDALEEEGEIATEKLL